MRPEVQRGIALLDEKCPGWHERIDIDSLDMASPTSCVIGQEFPDYACGLQELGLDFYDQKAVYKHGFDCPVDWDRFEAAYGELTEDWRQAIQQLRQKVTEATQ